MSNTASAALLCPIGIAIAKQLNADPKAVVMAIAVAASCAFATPVGTPPCTLVLGPGGYKFMDYVKCGTGLLLLCRRGNMIRMKVLTAYNMLYFLAPGRMKSVL